jgi:hypothetical protein
MKNKRSKFIGYRVPTRILRELNEVSPLYKSFSHLITEILLNWENSELYKKQLIEIEKMRFRILEKED